MTAMATAVLIFAHFMAVMRLRITSRTPWRCFFKGKISYTRNCPVTRGQEPVMGPNREHHSESSRSGPAIPLRHHVGGGFHAWMSQRIKQKRQQSCARGESLSHFKFLKKSSAAEARSYKGVVLYNTNMVCCSCTFLSSAVCNNERLCPSTQNSFAGNVTETKMTSVKNKRSHMFLIVVNLLVVNIIMQTTIYCILFSECEGYI